MQAVLLQRKQKQKGWLYPLLIAAAISVIVFSAIGAAALAGWLPRAERASDRQSTVQSGQNVAHHEKQVAVSGFEQVVDRRVGICADCGVVTSIVPVEVKGKTNGLGMIAGGVAGALVGNQIGRGNGNAVATVGGAAGGAYTGNEVEKHVKKKVRYQVRVRMHDGAYRTAFEPSARFAVGDKVKIADGHISKIG